MSAGRDPEGMPGWQRTFLASSIAVIAGALVVLVSDFGGWPKLMYLPYDREYVVASEMPDPSAMPFIGACLWGLGAGAIAFFLARVALNRRRQPFSSRVVSLFGAWALSSVALTGLYVTWNLWPF